MTAPFPTNAWLTYAEATARWGRQTSKRQAEYILATPEALAASPEVQALIDAAVKAERAKATDLHEALDACRKALDAADPDAIKAAVEAERERCARIAWESEDVYGARGMDGMAKCARNIAAAIRAG